jgi:hypothetical protein
VKDLKIYIGIASVLLIIYVIAEYNKPVPVDWSPTYVKTDKIPYGTYILYNRLPDIFPSTEISTHREAVYTLSNDSLLKSGSYIAIASSVELDQYDFARLIPFMKKGNEVFIATFNLGSFLEKFLKLKINSEGGISDKDDLSVRFSNPSLSKTSYTFDKGTGHQYFSKFDTARAIVLGTNERGHANFLKYPFGKGALYLVASPQFFTNYNMLKPGGADYAAKALSYVKPGENLIWDEHATRGIEGEQSPMRVFLKHPELRWAYYIALFSMLIFVVYQSKRRQRIIPLTDPMTNTTAEFVKVVGQVYYQQRNNHNIAEKKITYLLEFIRSNYQLKTSILDGEFREMLINKSGIEPAIIDQVLMYIHNVRSGYKISDSELIGLNKLIEHFY